MEISSDTVGGVIEGASRMYGPEFEKGVQTSRVWVNGESASWDQTVTGSDEVVLIPPVSGGSQPSTTLASTDLLMFAPAALALLAVLANLQGQGVWAAFLVAAVAVWAVDIGSTFAARGRLFAPLAVAVSSVGGAMAAHVLGGAGYGLSIAIAVFAGLGWAVVVPDYREVSTFSPILLVSLIGGLGTASMVLSRSAFTPDPSAVDVFLVAVIGGVVLGGIVERLPAMPLLDPFSVTAIGAVLGAVAAAVLWDLDLVGYLLAGLGVAIALVAGRGLSSMLRTGHVVLTERPPGLLASMDGVVLAASVYYPLLVIVL